MIVEKLIGEAKVSMREIR